MKVLWSVHTSDGGRHFNEDAYYADSEKGVFIVADGMGGPHCGDSAAKHSCFYISEFLESISLNQEATWAYERKEELSYLENVLRISFLITNERLYSQALDEFQKEVMGTQLVAAFLSGKKLVFGSVGCARAYMFRGDYLQQLTEDASYAKYKKIVPARVEKNMPLEVLGLQEKLNFVSLQEKSCKPGDKYLLISDGISSVLKNEEIQKIMSRKTNDLHSLCEELIDIALSRNCLDNATALVLEIPSEE